MFNQDSLNKRTFLKENKEQNKYVNFVNFDQIYKKFKKPILIYVGRFIENEETSEELTQEIFLKAFKYKDYYKNEFSLSTWLWSIARNTVIDWKRKTRLYSDLQLAPTPKNEIFDIEQAPDQDSNSEDKLLEKELRENLILLTQPLTDLQKKVLFMRVLDQLSYLEISKKLNLTLSSVKCLFHRAKTSLLNQVRPSECLFDSSTPCRPTPIESDSSVE